MKKSRFYKILKIEKIKEKWRKQEIN